MLAWLSAWRLIGAQELTRASVVEAERQIEAAEIAYRVGRSSQADVLAARVALDLLRDQLAGLEQGERRARNELRRWIGDAAERPIAADLPPWPEPDGDALLAQLDGHPHVAAQAAAVDAALADVRLAEEEDKPDWSVMFGYGYRPEFSNMATLQFEIGLPLFTANRQDRVVNARVAEVDRAEQMKQDWLRRHRAEIRADVDDWGRLRARIENFDQVILPQARQRLDAALAGYATGGGALLPILDSRRGLLDIRLQRLDLAHEAARRQVALQYFAHRETQP